MIWHCFWYLLDQSNPPSTRDKFMQMSYRPVMNWLMIMMIINAIDTDSDIDLIKAFNTKARVSRNESQPRLTNEQ